MRCRSYACMGQADFLLIGLEVADKLVEIFGWEFISGHNHHGATGGRADGVKVVYRVVSQVFKHGQIGGMAHMDHEQAVAIGFGTGHFGSANSA